jgi:PIN domain
MPTLHHIYVDYENVQNIQLPLIAGKPVHVTLVLGSRQDSLPVDLAKAFISHPAQVRLVETKATGKNALDFVLACELGGMCAVQRDAEYHIISRDKGFDAVIEHLKAHKIKVTRRDHFADVPILESRSPLPAKERPPTPPTLEERTRVIIEKLTRQPSNRPAKRTTLFSTIHAHLGKELPESDIEAVVTRLVTAKKVTILNTGKVQYSL